MNTSLSENIRNFIQDESRPTPFLVVDLQAVEKRYREIVQRFAFADCYYSVKANPARPVLELLVAAGAYFETASLREIQLCLEAGAAPERILFGNSIKKRQQIAAAHALGVRDHVFDSEAGLRALAAAAPGARLFCRLKMENPGAVWPLEHKFGCATERAIELMCAARDLGLEAHALSFHVGSQQRKPESWREGIAKAGAVMRALAQQGIAIRALDIGGGLPARDLHTNPALSTYAEAIASTLDEQLGDERPRIILEPGRAVVGDAGVMCCEVVSIRRDPDDRNKRWVYLDAGKFHGLWEAGVTPYRIVAQDREGELGAVTLAGPTCDSDDVLSNGIPYALPLSLEVGDRILVLSAGAYSTTYSSRWFNGFEPPAEHYI